MANTTVIMTIDLQGKSIRTLGRVAINEQVLVVLENIGGSSPSALTLSLIDGKTTVASCASFIASGDNAQGTLDLSVPTITALFNAESGPLSSKSLYLTLFDATLKSLRVVTFFTIQNCAFTIGMPAPTPA